MYSPKYRCHSDSSRLVLSASLLAGILVLATACGETSINPEGFAGFGPDYSLGGTGGVAGSYAGQAGSYVPVDNPYAGQAGSLPPAGGSYAPPPDVTGGTAGTIPTGGTGGAIITGGTGGVTAGGVGGTGGTIITGGTGGIVTAGTGGVGGATDRPGTVTGGTCCASGDCLCHGPDPSGLTSRSGSFNTQSYPIATGTVFYPTDADPPLAAVALCGGFTNTGPEMNDWGPFYASHGIVTVITTTTGMDIPAIRADKLLGAIEELKTENTKSGSPLFGKLAGRYGTSGYSMGGGGTTIASGTDPTLRTSVGLAAWGPVAAGVQVPTLLLCGSSDGVAPCTMSTGAYAEIPDSTPKMLLSISGASHMSWFGPTSAGGGTSGEYALAFQKVYLEGDERWKPLLVNRPSDAADWQTNIQ